MNTDGCRNDCTLDPSFVCTNIVGEKTACGLPPSEDGTVVQVCQDPTFILSGRALNVNVLAALAGSSFASARTVADVVSMIVSTTDGVTTINPFLES